MQCEVLSGHSDPFHLLVHWMWQSCWTTGKCPQLCGFLMYLQAAHLVILSVTFPVGNAGTEGQGGSARVAVSFQFQVQAQYPWGECSDTSCPASCLLLKSPWLSTFSAFSQQVLCMCLQVLHGHGVAEGCALLHILCASCSKAPWAFPQETSTPSVTRAACQTPSVWGFHAHRQKLFV